MKKELMNNILNELPNECLEDMGFVEFEGVKYACCTKEELTTEDEGKYQIGGSIYGIGLFDEENGYGVKGETLFYVEQDFTQTGSYYEYQEREYEKPYIVEEKEKIITVWEKVK